MMPPENQTFPLRPEQTCAPAKQAWREGSDVSRGQRKTGKRCGKPHPVIRRKLHPATHFLRSLLAKKTRFPWLLEVEVAPHHMRHVITSSVFSRIMGVFFSHSWGWIDSCPRILFHLVLSGHFQGGHLGRSRHLRTAFLASSLCNGSACVWRGSSLPHPFTPCVPTGPSQSPEQR